VTNYEEMIYRTIGDSIRRCREKAGMKQEQLAQEIHVSRPSIANYESGKQAIYISDLYLMAKSLKVKMSELLPDENEVQALASVETALEKAGDLTRREKKALENFVREAENKGEDIS
jgi:transcriptional regulator with XRE-family HTH domain